MIRLYGDKDVLGLANLEVACSGGSDSMAVCDFLSKGRKVYTPLFFDHGTETSTKALKFLKSKFPHLNIGRIKSPNKPKAMSWEEYWRNERNRFFKTRDSVIITGHNLDDAVESWLMSSCHGSPRLPFYNNGIVRRPFMTWPKAVLTKRCIDNGVSWIEDETNQDIKFKRNLTRKELIPAAIKLNPGLYGVIQRKLIAGYNNGDLIYNG